MDLQHMSYNEVSNYVFSVNYSRKYDVDLKKYYPMLYFDKYGYKYNYHYPDYDMDE